MDILWNIFAIIGLLTIGATIGVCLLCVIMINGIDRNERP